MWFLFSDVSKEVKLEQEKKIFIFYEKYVACFQDFQSFSP